MTRRGDICACGHARHFHALKLVAGGYRNDQCWADGCWCAEFEHEKPSHLRSEAAPTARPMEQEAVAADTATCSSESSPPASFLPARAGEPSTRPPGAAHTAPARPNRR